MLLAALVLCSFSCGTDGATFDVLTYGAVGDGATDDTIAIATALRAGSSSPPPSTILFPNSHTFLTGPLNMSSGMTLQVEGTLKAISGNNTAGGAAYIKEGWPQIPPLKVCTVCPQLFALN